MGRRCCHMSSRRGSWWALTCVSVLRYTALPWIRANYAQGNYAWQRDGAPSPNAARSSTRTTWWTSDPRSSGPHLPLTSTHKTCFWWRAIERLTITIPRPNLASLKAKIAQQSSNYSEEAVWKKCAAFQLRVQAVVATGGIEEWKGKMIAYNYC